MHRIVSCLVQLQDLSLIRKEKEILSHGDHLAKIDALVMSMTEALPSDVRAHYERLRLKKQIAVTPISAGACSACGIKLPTSLIQMVRTAKVISVCPNCSRILYCAEAVPRGKRPAHGRLEPEAAGICRFSSPRLMVPRLKSTGRAEVIKELAERMAKEGVVDNPGQLIDMALKHEAVLATDADCGMAFPHVRGIEGGGLTLSLGLSPSGVGFGDGDDSKANMVFFIVIPTAASGYYLEMLGGLSRTFSSEAARKELMATEKPEDMWQALMNLTRNNIK